MPHALGQAVARWRRRALLQAWVEQGVQHVAVGLFVAGSLVLLCRIAFGWERTQASAWLALAALACVTAWLSARRAVPSADRAAAWLDVESGASGLVVTESELGETPWSQAARERIARAANAERPVRWPRSSWATLVALAFAGGALWFEPERARVGPPAAVTEAALERVEEQLATLNETLALEPDLAAELEQRLERIEAEAEEGLPESTFEALDNFEQRLEQSASEALESAQRANDGLSAAMTEPALDEAQTGLEAALEAMRAAGLQQGLSEQLSAQLEAGTLTLPEGLKLDSAELAKLAQGLRGQLDGRLGNLAKAGLLSQKQLERLGELASLDDFDFDHVCDEECFKPGGT